MEENNQKTQGQNKIVAAIIVAGFIVAGAILLRGSTPSELPVKQATGASKTDIADIRPVSTDEHILGNPNADILIVEYSDTECPYCKMFHASMHNIVNMYDGKVAWVYRHYPIEQLHKKAFNEALATECAWEQGGNNAFWQFIDLVYSRTNSNDSLDASELPAIAQEIGLNLTSFNSCLTTQKYAGKVQTDSMDGAKAGISGTPTSYILKGGVVVDIIQGAAPLENVKDKIDRVLQ